MSFSSHSSSPLLEGALKIDDQSSTNNLSVLNFRCEIVDRLELEVQLSFCCIYGTSGKTSKIIGTETATTSISNGNPVRQ